MLLGRKVKLKKLKREDEGTPHKEKLGNRQKTQGIHDNRQEKIVISFNRRLKNKGELEPHEHKAL